VPRTQNSSTPAKRRDNAYLQRFGERLRERRLEQRWSQELLGERAGLDRSYVSSLERGEQDPRLGTIRKLVAALGCRIADLVE
jgi:transcriptional regulator with XRE-family HTH domain